MSKIDYVKNFIESLSLITGIEIEKIEEYSKENNLLNVIERPNILQPDKEQLNKLKLLKDFINQYNLVKAFGRNERIQFTSHDIAGEFFHNVLGNRKDKEAFAVAFLDTKNRLIESRIISVGILNAALISPREILKAALANECNSIIIAHNHPSGDPTPSKEDLDQTQRIVNIFEPLGINVLDHIIIGDYNYSLREQGLMNTRANNRADYSPIKFYGDKVSEEIIEDLWEEEDEEELEI